MYDFPLNALRKLKFFRDKTKYIQYVKFTSFFYEEIAMNCSIRIWIIKLDKSKEQFSGC